MREHLRLMVRYNKWANARLIKAITALDEADYMAARPAFFGSIHGALNHLLLVDRLWRGRVDGTPYPAKSLDQAVTPDRATYIRERVNEDDILISFTDSFDADALEQPVTYSSLVGVDGTDKRRVILAHMFNHATHHRGQVHALLTQVPSDPPPLDLMYYMRETEPK